MEDIFMFLILKSFGVETLLIISILMMISFSVIIKNKSTSKIINLIFYALILFTFLLVIAYIIN